MNTTSPETYAKLRNYWSLIIADITSNRQLYNENNNVLYSELRYAHHTIGPTDKLPQSVDEVIGLTKESIGKLVNKYHEILPAKFEEDIANVYRNLIGTNELYLQDMETLPVLFSIPQVVTSIEYLKKKGIDINGFD